MAQQPTLGVRQLSPAEAFKAAPAPALRGGGPRLSAPLKAKAPQARAEALGEGEQYVGYFDEEGGIGYNAGSGTVTMATFCDPLLTGRYVGDQVTRLRAYFYQDISSCTLWLSETLGGERLMEFDIPAESLPGAEGGIVEVQLPTPYTIPANGFYIGYDAACRETGEGEQYYPLILGMSGLLRSEGALLSTDGGNSWSDLTDSYYSSSGFLLTLGMDAAIVSENHSGYDLAITDFHADSYVVDRSYDNGQGAYPMIVVGSVVNYGTEASTGFNLSVSCNGEEYWETRLQFQSPLESFTGGLFMMTLPVDLSLAEATFSFTASPLDAATTDLCESNNTTPLPTMIFYDPDQAVAKTPLIEMYTGAGCVFCPYGHASVSAAAATSHPAIVAHHVGYEPDIYTIDESYTYMDAFGVGGAPSATSDRAWVILNDGCVFSTSYDNAEEGGAAVNDAISMTGVLIPAFATITAVPSYNPDTRELTVTVSGAKSDAALFDHVMAAPRVHAYLTEDGLVGDQIRPNAFGGRYTDHNYVHDHVLRAVLGEDAAWGVAPVWDGDNYTATFTATLDPEWVPENMNIVAFITNESGEGPWNHAVMNAAQVDLAGKDTGISATPAGEGFAAWGGEGRVCLSGDFRSFRVYTLQGAEVPASGLAAGIYVVAVETDGGTQVRKVAVR